MVAFTAIKETTQNNIGVNQNIIFEHVILNEGGAYHAQHGIFVAPVSGYYLFATSLLHPQINQPLRGGLMHNGNLVAIAYATENIWAQGSQTVVLKITTGDEVWIKNLDFEHEVVNGDAYSSFSGVILLKL
ncbi:hypothetical protein DPMN_043435 [Dreissena polymorpha]|uniref:C1q domain-containing protein n=1 Tax=Dreissena polymorpha TaxID=45954 RepID=A0A9D4D1D3_DREPO|nr:hypothetical protein DPMN_043435 [Dreissena polymorpha]